MRSTPSRAKHLGAILIAAVVLCPALAIADDDARKKKAGDFFARGELLFESEDYAKAAAAFSLAYELAPHPSVLANIALSFERAGDLPPAIEHWERYLESLEDDAERPQIESRLGELRRQVGQLTIECPRASCEISIDGIDRGAAPLTVILTAGTHHLEAYAGGEKLAALDTRVEAEEHARVELFASAGVEQVEPAEPVTSTAPTEEASADRDGLALGPGFWVSSAVAVVAGGCTIGFGVKTLKDEDEFKESGRTDEALADQGERDKLITNVMIGVTAAAATTAIVFAIYDLTRGEESEQPDTAEQVALTTGPGLGIGVAARF